jgi:hypothetical protein
VADEGGGFGIVGGGCWAIANEIDETKNANTNRSITQHSLKFDLDNLSLIPRATQPEFSAQALRAATLIMVFSSPGGNDQAPGRRLTRNE